LAISSIPFIFVFLPIFLLVYYLVPKKWWRSGVLFLGSVFFFIWLDPNNIVLLLTLAILNYIFGLLISLAQNKGTNSPFSKLAVAIAVIGNLGVLVFYKYAGFLTSILAGSLGINLGEPQTALPLGISYFTFTGIAYVVDVYHQVIPVEQNPLRLANFLIMFPKILLGPIARYQQVTENLENKWWVNPDFIKGVQRFVTGLGKKVILADNLSIAATKVFSTDFSQLGAGTAWFGLTCYALQIFFDFSGYTDMALGLGLMLGYHLPENFDFPYISKSITEFWRRWHMSLTAWFRAYIFLPLEFRWRKLGILRRPLTILIVFLLTGLWHGAGWNFILWGGYFGVVLTLEAIGWEKVLKKLPAFLQHFYTLLVIWVGWVFFKLTALDSWGNFFGSLVGVNGKTAHLSLRTLNILVFVPFMILAFIFATPLMKNLARRIASKGIPGKVVLTGFYLLVFVLSIGYLLSNGYVSFLYSQF
jgi:alginate O-acetyltransferase complex protein AlgI